MPAAGGRPRGVDFLASLVCLGETAVLTRGEQVQALHLCISDLTASTLRLALGDTAVLTRGAQVLAACTFVPHAAEGFAELLLLAVRRQHSRRGHGSLLLRAVEGWLCRQGVRYCISCASNDCTTFWAKHGYHSDVTMQTRWWTLVRDPFGSSVIMGKAVPAA